jgi:hypothetical protein
MKQQPILTADEVIELLEKHVITNEAERVAFQQLLDKTKLTNTPMHDPDTQFPLLARGRDFLRSKGIYVYFGIDDFGLYIYCCFIAGECARVFHKLVKQYSRLGDLSKFADKHKDILPQHIRSKANLLRYYYYEIDYYLSSILLETYIRSSKRKLKRACEEGWELAKEVDAFLESIEDLRRLHALATAL